MISIEQLSVYTIMFFNKSLQKNFVIPALYILFS